MKTPQTNDSLSKAVADLGAKEVAPGKVAIQNKCDLGSFPSGTWYVFPLSVISQPGPIWFGNGVPMPAWWNPEQRFAWALDRKTGNKREAFDGTQDEGIKALSRLACHITNGLPRGRKRITADLTTGAEVPA